MYKYKLDKKIQSIKSSLKKNSFHPCTCPLKWHNFVLRTSFTQAQILRCVINFYIPLLKIFITKIKRKKRKISRMIFSIKKKTRQIRRKSHLSVVSSVQNGSRSADRTVPVRTIDPIENRNGNGSTVQRTNQARNFFHFHWRGAPPVICSVEGGFSRKHLAGNSVASLASSSTISLTGLGGARDPETDGNGQGKKRKNEKRKRKKKRKNRRRDDAEYL